MTLSGEANISRLVLGTVQFGLNYGISNKHGQITQQEVDAILSSALLAGITTLDTAAAYGESEKSIGASLKATDLNFRVISKYPPNQPGLAVVDAFQQSLHKLGVNRLHAYLLHSFASYSNNPGIIKELQQLKGSGKVDKIGISLYHPEEAIELLQKEVEIDIVQFPYSVFDRRFEELLPLLRKQGVETHVRSVYLQGLYFMAPDSLPAHLSAAGSKILGLQQLAREYKLPLGAMLLGFVLSNPNITYVVIGVENLETLQDNIDYCGTTLNPKLLKDLQDYQEDNENIILPYKWTNT